MKLICQLGFILAAMHLGSDGSMILELEILGRKLPPTGSKDMHFGTGVGSKSTQILCCVLSLSKSHHNLQTCLNGHQAYCEATAFWSWLVIGLPPISWLHNWFWLIYLFLFFPLCQDDCFQGWICYYGPTRSSRGLVDALRNSARDSTKELWKNHIFQGPIPLLFFPGVPVGTVDVTKETSIFIRSSP